MTCRLGILLSGRGSNFEAIADAIEAGTLKQAEIVVVLSNKPDAGGLATAKQKNLPTGVITSDTEILDQLRQHRVDLVILAGYNRILSPQLVEAYPNRILNIHPSLLPAYGGKGMVGLKVHAAVVAAGERQSGCTVHLVTQEVDAGPILGQATVHINRKETPETLAQKILKEEHKLYPAIIGRYIARKFSSVLSSDPCSTEEIPCLDSV